MLLIVYKKCKKLFKENNPIKVLKIEFQLKRQKYFNFIKKNILVS